MLNKIKGRIYMLIDEGKLIFLLVVVKKFCKKRGFSFIFMLNGFGEVFIFLNIFLYSGWC